MDMSTAHDEGMEHRLNFDQADRLGKALRLAGMTSGEMAEYLGVHRNSVTNWVKGHNNADKRTLMLWALRTGVPLEWIETGVLNDESPSGDDPEGQAWPAGSGGPVKCTPRDSNPEPIDYGTVVPLFGRIAA